MRGVGGGDMMRAVGGGDVMRAVGGGDLFSRSATFVGGFCQLLC